MYNRSGSHVFRPWPLRKEQHPCRLGICETLLAVLSVRESHRMEGAYGLAITFDMLMTTTLLVYYFTTAKKSTFRSAALALIFFSLEGLFLVSNMSKFFHGGWFSFTIALMFFL